MKSQSIHLHAHSFSSFCFVSKVHSILPCPPRLMKMNVPLLSQFTSSCVHIQITFVREAQQGLVGPSSPERAQWWETVRRPLEFPAGLFWKASNDVENHASPGWDSARSSGGAVTAKSLHVQSVHSFQTRPPTQFTVWPWFVLSTRSILKYTGMFLCMYTSQKKILLIFFLHHYAWKCIVTALYARGHYWAPWPAADISPRIDSK